MAVFKERHTQRNARYFRSIQFDSQTKIDILKEQFKLLLGRGEATEKLAAEQYIRTLLADLRKDFSHDEARLEIVQQLEYSLPFYNEKEKELKKMLRKL